jgi:hypothetical protein
MRHGEIPQTVKAEASVVYTVFTRYWLSRIHESEKISGFLLNHGVFGSYTLGNREFSLAVLSTTRHEHLLLLPGFHYGGAAGAHFVAGAVGGESLVRRLPSCGETSGCPYCQSGIAKAACETMSRAELLARFGAASTCPSRTKRHRRPGMGLPQLDRQQPAGFVDSLAAVLRTVCLISLFLRHFSSPTFDPRLIAAAFAARVTACAPSWLRN